MLDSQAPGAIPCPVDVHIGGRAAARRQTLGLSLGDVAQNLGVDGAELSDLERGRQRIAARQLWRLSRLLQVPMAWFFKVPGEDPQPRAEGAPKKAAQLLFVPNPDLDRSGDIELVPLH